MATLITLRSDLPSYRQQVTLDGEVFILDLRWNTRAEAWFLDLYDRDETPILVGRALTLGMPVWGRYRNLALPKGQLVMLDTTNRDADPGLNDLGTRVQLVYFDASEVAG